MKFLLNGLLIESAAGMLLAPPLASAGGSVNWSVTIGSPVPVYAPPPVVYVHPEPVYVRPAPVYYHAPPVQYVRPSPVYVQPPVVVQYGSPYQMERPRHRHGHSYHHREQYYGKHHHN